MLDRQDILDIRGRCPDELRVKVSAGRGFYSTTFNTLSAIHCVLFLPLLATGQIFLCEEGRSM